MLKSLVFGAIGLTVMNFTFNFMQYYTQNLLAQLAVSIVAGSVVSWSLFDLFSDQGNNSPHQS